VSLTLSCFNLNIAQTSINPVQERLYSSTLKKSVWYGGIAGTQIGKMDLPV
jgi:hypothetical protein